MQKEKVPVLTICLLLAALVAFADMPGNKVRSDVKANFKNVSALGNYSLRILDYNDSILITKDTLYTIYASRGVPHQVAVFAVYNNANTDTIFMSEFEQHNFEITFTGVQNNKLIYSTSFSSLENDDTSSSKSNLNESSTAASLKRFWKTNELLIGVSVVALVALIAFFLWRKRKPGRNNIDPVL
ncbi:MAG: hypothetical protein ABI921_11200 [Panacibacter sp.]